MKITSKIICTLALALVTLTVMAEDKDSVVLVRENGAHDFGTAIPAGNYSGIVNVDGDLYALVSDKGKSGEVVFVRMDIDSKTGDIKKTNLVYSLPTGEKNRDYEDIVLRTESKSFFIVGEEDNEVKEFAIDKLENDGVLSETGRRLNFGDLKGKTHANRGLESLAYDVESDVFWTTTECPLEGDGEVATVDNGVEQRLRLISTDLNGNMRQYAYKMDVAEKKVELKTFLKGVSAITALGKDRLLVLEREVHIPSDYLGAFSIMKIYAVDIRKEAQVPVSEPLNDNSPFVHKHLVCKWRTSLSLLNYSFANYEGMCLGPRLDDGSQVIVLVSDSQNQYAGVLSDWFKTIVVR